MVAHCPHLFLCINKHLTVSHTALRVAVHHVLCTLPVLHLCTQTNNMLLLAYTSALGLCTQAMPHLQLRPMLLALSAQLSLCADWDKCLGCNVKGYAFGMKHAARAMILHREEGSIINVASISAWIAQPGWCPRGLSEV